MRLSVKKNLLKIRADKGGTEVFCKTGNIVTARGQVNPPSCQINFTILPQTPSVETLVLSFDLPLFPLYALHYLPG